MLSDTTVIVFASQKGGSGKTTLSGHIAVQAELSGAGPVAIIDTDPQKSLTQWHNARGDRLPMLKASDVGNVARDIEQMGRNGANLIVIDTPPAATAAIGEVVKHADLVCIPTRPSPHDMRAVGATIDIVETHQKPMVFVLNSAAVKARITSESALALSQHGTVAQAIIHNRVDFASSMTDGRTVMEVNEGSRSSTEIILLWDYIAERLEKVKQAKAASKAATQIAQAPVQTPQPLTPSLALNRTSQSQRRGTVSAPTAVPTAAAADRPPADPRSVVASDAATRLGRRQNPDREIKTLRFKQFFAERHAAPAAGMESGD